MKWLNNLAARRCEGTPTLIAAILHDTLEDTNTTENELRERFGDDVLSVVLEVTDNKALEKIERKRLQVIHAPDLSYPAKIIKLADKRTNCFDVLHFPPKDWTLERRRNYIQWAADVIALIRGTNGALESAFDEMLIIWDYPSYICWILRARLLRKRLCLNPSPPVSTSHQWSMWVSPIKIQPCKFRSSRPVLESD